MVQDPYKYFRPEARELVDQFAKGVLELEKDGGSTGAVQKLLRVAHTLKGAARVVKQSQIADSAHALEDMLSPYRDKAHDIARDQIDLILAHLDQISSRLDTLDAAGAADRPETRKRDGEENQRTFRADVAETDAVLEGVAEAHALLNKLRGTVRAVGQARRLTDLLTAQLGPLAAADGARQSSPGPSRRIALAQELGRTFAGIERGLGTAVDQMDRELRQLREAAERLRLIAAGTLFTALERTARDAARALGKNVGFASRGGDIRLDARVLETMQGALIQIVRNAVAHGIEPEAERIAAGKPSAGKVSVHVTRRGQRIAFQVSDDGRGVDLEAVHKVASERGLIDRGGRSADAEALVRLLLKGGISTSATVTGVAGRGVGLDVVREGLERLGGEVLLRTERGVGTTVDLVIPPSLASMDVLIAEAEGPDGAACVSSMPLDAVRGTLLVRPGEISRGSPGDTIVYDGRAIPFIPLAAALDGTSWSPRRGWTTIVLESAGGEAAIGVDRLLGTGRMVVRPLPEHLHASPTVVGATLDSDGNPQLVLDTEQLAAAARRGSQATVEPTPSGRRILVVDDSLTTRMLEQSILESAGYDVDLAISAEEALEILRGNRYALILVDVEMPGMDGFTFIARIRSDAELRETPAILVTSRASPEDLQRGRDVGANGHIAKSEFDQAELLATISRLMR